MSAAEKDPRVALFSDYLRRSAEGKIPVNGFDDLAEEVLGELDGLSPNETIRRLQEELVAAWGGEASDWELERASQIVAEIGMLRAVQSEITDRYPAVSFTGMDHPLWANAEARIVALRDELEELR